MLWDSTASTKVPRFHELLLIRENRPESSELIFKTMPLPRPPLLPRQIPKLGNSQSTIHKNSGIIVNELICFDNQCLSCHECNQHSQHLGSLHLCISTATEFGEYLENNPRLRA